MQRPSTPNTKCAAKKNTLALEELHATPFRNRHQERTHYRVKTTHKRPNNTHGNPDPMIPAQTPNIARQASVKLTSRAKTENAFQMEHTRGRSGNLSRTPQDSEGCQNSEYSSRLPLRALVPLPATTETNKSNKSRGPSRQNVHLNPEQTS